MILEIVSVAATSRHSSVQVRKSQSPLEGVAFLREVPKAGRNLLVLVH